MKTRARFVFLAMVVLMAGLAFGPNLHSEADGANESQQKMFYQAVYSGKTDEVRTMLAANPALAKSTREGGGTPLHTAARKGRTGIIPLLLANGAEVNASDTMLGDTPLHYAVWDVWDQFEAKHQLATAKLLIEAGADVNKQNSSGETPLFLVSTPEVARLLIAHGAEVNVRDEYGMTPLHQARSKEIAAVLLGAGADIAARGNDGSTPLMFALAFDRSLDLVQLLVARGVDVRATTKDGQTALYEAQTKDAAAFLIAKGAEVNIRDAEGITPIQAAASNNHEEVVELLKLKGAAFDAQDLEKRLNESRKEAQMSMYLSQLFQAQVVYYSEHNTYAGTNQDQNANAFSLLSWTPSNKNTPYSFYLGKSKLPCRKKGCDPCANQPNLSGAGPDSFTIMAAGNIDNDAVCDVWTINDAKEIKNIVNDSP
jgi:ankyrin repeat protein